MIRFFLSGVLVGAALVLTALTLPSCGEAGAENDGSTQVDASSPTVDSDVLAYEEPTPAYSTILEELQDAVRTGATYRADRRARELGPVERSAVRWFCETAWQLKVNGELHTLPDAGFLAGLIRDRVVLELNQGDYTNAGKAPYVAPVGVAIAELQRIIDLHSFDAALDRRYVGSCYGD